MKTKMKRLLSFVAVLAMVFSMFPVFHLPTVAATEVEQEAAQTVRFPSDVETYEAECPVCKTSVTWKPYNGEHYSESTVLKTASHFYLTEDKTYASGKSFLSSWRDVCFNLNGYNITAEVGAYATFSCTRKLNLMDTYGGSVVTGYANKSTSGAVLSVNGGGASAAYHLYGGTYRKLAEDTQAPIVHIRPNGGTVTVHDGAVIDDRNAGEAVKISGGINTSGTVLKATFDVRGGEIKGNMTVGVSGASSAGCAAFHMYSGTITGNVTVNNGAAFSAGGGTINGTVTAASGTTVTLSGAPKLPGGLSLGGGVVADITELTKDARIAIKASEVGVKLTIPPGRCRNAEGCFFR